MPVLLVFNVNAQGQLSCRHIVELSGNILDVVPLADPPLAFLVSIDNVHEPGSTDRWRQEPDPKLSMIQQLCLDPKDGDVKVLTKVLQREESFEVEPRTETNAKPQKPALGEILYGLENLRKQKQQAEPEDQVVLPE